VLLLHRGDDHAARMDVSANATWAGVSLEGEASCATRGPEPARLRQRQDQRPLAGGRSHALAERAAQPHRGP